MKKKILLFIMSFFVFSNTVFAAKVINTETMDLTIDENGDATVTEIWTVQKQTMDYLEKDFRLQDNVVISDVSISDATGNEYKPVESYTGETNTYTSSRKNDHFTLKFFVDGSQNAYTLTYKINNFVALYDDSIGTDWYLISRNKYQTISSLTISIHAPVALTEENTLLYILGSTSKITFKYANDAIEIYAADLKIKNQVRIVASFNTTAISSKRKVDMTFNEAYKKAQQTNELIDELSEYVTPSLLRIIAILFGTLFLIVILSKLFKRTKKFNEYAGVKSANGVNKVLMDSVNYCETIPCNGDLYKISFISGYYKISKNRSDLIGAIILKWVYEGKARIIYDKDKPVIKLIENQYFERKLDLDLYEMLQEASYNNQLDNNKLQRYALTHYLRVMTWFNMGFNESINDEVQKGNIHRSKKHTILSDKEFATAVDIMGLKKYLLNFNQVPRQTELTEEGYKYLLIMAELLGIGESVSREILRKNPDNYMAKSLLDLESARYIYKNVYQTSLAPYKEITKNRKIKSNYDPELDNLLQQKGTQVERNSKL